MTECIQDQFEFQGLGSRRVVADFSGGTVTSDAGGLLLREVERKRKWIEQAAHCFTDHRNAGLVEHTVAELLGQRIYGVAFGYEDLNDHELLRVDPLLATLCEKSDPAGHNRRQERDKGKALAGKSTLSRLEHGQGASDRYKRIKCNQERLADLFVHQFIRSHTVAPQEIILDLDATDDPLHGHQEGRFFHGYYDRYCYLPLYIFCGSFLLCAKLRTANQDASAGALDEVKRIVDIIRAAWPDVHIVLRADSGFARDDLMSWCEEERGVDYVFGLSRNVRLEAMLTPAMEATKNWHEMTRESVRTFMGLRYRTRKSWSRARRVIGKAEYSNRGPNPRFIVTSLSERVFPARMLYEQVYCARGDMENRIKEQQLDLYADRTSTGTMQANQLRLYISSIAYCLLNDMREMALKDTRLAKAQCGTIRTLLMKIGAIVRVSVRRVFIQMASSHPYQDVFAAAWRSLRAAPATVT